MKRKQIIILLSIIVIGIIVFFISKRFLPCQELSSFGNAILQTDELPQKTLNLSDGTNVQILQNSHFTSYNLTDGTELLRVQNPSGPDNVYVNGIENFDNLSEAAKSNILAYYTEQGTLYDVNTELERAYAEYQHTENKDEFSTYFLSQEILPIASNENVIYFMTSAFLPIDGRNGNEMRLGAAFDRKTGEHINGWELFNCSEEEAKQRILDIAQITDLAEREELESAFDFEYILMFSDNLEVSFQAGTLSNYEHTYVLALDYSQELCQILNDWAIPEHSE